MPTHKIRPFELEQLKKGSNILIVGRRGVGKSFLCTQLLTCKEHVAPIVFSSKYVAQCYREYIPNSHVLDTFDATKLKHILRRQMESNSDSDTEIIVAFDDITYDGRCLMDNNDVRDLVKYGSSLNITSIFAAQHAGVYDETFRRNVDYVFIFHDNLVDNQMILYQKYGNMFSAFEDFQAVYTSCTRERHRCLVLDMRTPWDHSIPDHDTVPDGVYWYMSPNLHKRDFKELFEWTKNAERHPPLQEDKKFSWLQRKHN